MQGKVSMVVPCYNKENYISTMLDSVIAQKWDNIEVILVNDGSTDGTRDIITEYELKLLERGYEVVIIDQENAGCCAAVYAGLIKMTGDYFCLVDCDDEIMPEYVSRMAGWLDENDDYEWAACDYLRAVQEGKDFTIEPAWYVPERQDTTNLIEQYILRRVITMAWIYMIRIDYVKKCGLIDAFCIERLKTYEPGIVVPPAIAGGKLKFFNVPLYKYNIFASDLYRFSTFEDAKKYYDDYLFLYEYTIKNLDISEDKKKRYINLARYTHKYQQVNHLHLENGEKYRRELAEQISTILNAMFLPQPKISSEDIIKKGFESLHKTLCRAVLGQYKDLDEKIKTAKRIIGYGVLGKRGRNELPNIIDTPLQPTLLWDNSANNEELYGLPVKKPVFTSLTESDLILIFPITEHIVEDITQQLSQTKISTIIYSNEIKVLSSLYVYKTLIGCEVI